MFISYTNILLSVSVLQYVGTYSIKEYILTKHSFLLFKNVKWNVYI